MADDLIHSDDRPDPAARFRADLAGYLRGLSGPELADLLAGLPDPVIAELAACGPAHARLPDTWPGHPDSWRGPCGCPDCDQTAPARPRRQHAADTSGAATSTP